MVPADGVCKTLLTVVTARASLTTNATGHAELVQSSRIVTTDSTVRITYAPSEYYKVRGLPLGWLTGWLAGRFFDNISSRKLCPILRHCSVHLHLHLSQTQPQLSIAMNHQTITMDSRVESSTAAFEYSVHTLTQMPSPEVEKVLGLLFRMHQGAIDRQLDLQRAPLDCAELILYELDQWPLPTDGQQILEMLHDLEYTLAKKILQSARTLCNEEPAKNSPGRRLDITASDFDFMVETAPILRDFMRFTTIVISSYISNDQSEASRKTRVDPSQVGSKPRMSKYIQRILMPDDYKGYQEFSRFLLRQPILV